MKPGYKKLELDKILVLLSNEAWSDTAKENVLKIEPQYAIDIIKKEHQNANKQIYLLCVIYQLYNDIQVKYILQNTCRVKAYSVNYLQNLPNAFLLFRSIRLYTYHGCCVTL